MVESSRWQAGAWGLTGGLLALALARLLYVADPLRFTLLTQLAVVLLLVGVAAAGIAALAVWRGWSVASALPGMLFFALGSVWPVAHSATLPTLWLTGLLGILAWGWAWQGAGSAVWQRWAGWPVLALMVGLLGLYLLTLAPTVGQADTFEFQVNVLRLGINHGSGYPAYMLLAKPFTWLPFGNPAWRVNLSSAVFGALAAGTLFMLARQAGGGRAAALLAGATLGVSYGVWSRAVEAEVYTLHLLFVGAIVWLSLALPSQPRVYLPLLGLAIGVSFANHLTTGLLGPVVLLAVGLLVWRDDGLKAGWQPWALSAGLLLAGLAIYLYLPLRWPAINNGEGMTWEIFMRFISGEEAHGALRPLAFVQDFSRYGVVGRKALEAFGPVGALLSALGWGWLLWKQWRAAVYTGLVWLAFIYFGISFYVPDPDFSAFLLPAVMMQALWLGLGVQALLDGVGERRELRSAVVSVALLFPVLAVMQNYPRVQQPFLWEAYRLGQAMMAEPLAEGATVLADSQKMPPLFYLQVAEGVRRDLAVVVLPLEESYRAELDARLAAGGTVYLGRFLPRLGEAYHLNSVGPLVEVTTTARRFLPAAATALEGDFGAIALTGVTADGVVAAGGDLALTVFWQAVAPPSGNYQVVWRLVDAEGRVVQHWPGVVPVAQMYPTNAWRTGEVIADYHRLRLDSALPVGDYRLQVNLLPAFSHTGPGQWTDVLPVTVSVREALPAPEGLLRASFSRGWHLLGVDAPTTATPGSEITVRLHWAHSTEAHPLTVRVLADGQVVATVTLAPATGRVITPVTLTAPTAGAEFTLALAGADGQTCGWLRWPEPACDLPPIVLEGAALPAGAVNYDGKVALLAVAVDRAEAAPGEVVVVTAEWLSLAAMDENYTVFVQFIGPDGLLYGQVDIWPAQGTLATRNWPVGQRVSDRFEIRLREDAPPGAYQLAVGWYLLQTLQRLPRVDETGQAVGDAWVIPAFVVGDD